MIKKWVYLFVFTLISGCASQGPKHLEASRGSYNNVLQQTNQEQLLLNLVRLKYRDTPYFLEVSGLASQLSLSTQIKSKASLLPSVSDNYALEGSLGYTEKPTISYSPLQGDKFVKRLLTPVSADKIILLYRSGWSIERVLRLAVQRINGIKNAPSASGPTPNYVPEFQAFVKATKIMRELQKQDGLKFYYAMHQNTPVLVMDLLSSDVSQKTSELLQTLKLPLQTTYYFASDNLTKNNQQFTSLETRSMLGMLFFLSQNIAVPEVHRQAGLVTVTRQQNNSEFNWNEVSGDLLKIKSSSSKPAQSAVSVHYRGYWFYIDDADLPSKSTFSMLSELFSLQSGNSKQVAPVLTLSVGN